MSRVVLITGAAGGLGAGLAREFSAQGWRVAAGYHQAKLEEQSPMVRPIALDVVDRRQAAAAVEEIVERWGSIDALINNAGVTADALAIQLSDEDWQSVIDVNLKGAAICSQAVLRPMLKQRRGHIINISSYSGRCGAMGQANYASAKAGLLGLTQALAKEVGARNICVNAVLPGVLATAMTAGLEVDARKAFAAANALGRINSVEEVARFIVFLTTLENVSGQIFQLDSRIAAWT